MSATGESEVIAAEHPAKEVMPEKELQPAEMPEKEQQQAEKPAKEKKPKVPKEKKPKASKASSHPPYFQMIEEAILALSDKSGSSPYAIAKYMEEKHKAVLPANFRKMLGLQLKNSASRGKLIKVKASYKLSEAGKKEKGAAKVAKSDEAKKPKQANATTAPRTRAAKKSETTKKATKPAKKVGAKKMKKSTPTKPKSIKSPAAKKSKKTTA